MGKKKCCYTVTLVFRVCLAIGFIYDPFAEVLQQHRQLLVWLLMNWNRGSVWPPNIVFTRNQERQWLQLLRKIVLATPPLFLWNSDTDVEFPLFCCRCVEARAPILLCPSYLPVCISSLMSLFRGLSAILKLNLSQPKINPQLSLCSLNPQVCPSRTSQIWGRMSKPPLSLRTIEAVDLMSKGQHGSAECEWECLYSFESTENRKWGVKMWHGKRGIPAVSSMKISTSHAVQLNVWTGEKSFVATLAQVELHYWISLPSDLHARALPTPCVLSNHQVFTLHPWPPFPLPPPSWMRLSTLSFPVVSALSYFPTPCKWHWPAQVNSHSAEEMSQSFGGPNSDCSSITKAANTHYAPITGCHSHSCNTIQSCKKAQSRTPSPTSAEANLRGWEIGKTNIARQHMRSFLHLHMIFKYDVTHLAYKECSSEKQITWITL